MMRRLSFLLSSSSRDQELINLTPLIDVVFVILILFILVVPLFEFEKIELPNGSLSYKNEVPLANQKQAIAIYLFSNNTISIDQESVKEKDLGQVLKKLKAKKPEAKVRLFADKAALFGTYQLIKNGLSEAGFEEMDLILNPGFKLG